MKRRRISARVARQIRTITLLREGLEELRPILRAGREGEMLALGEMLAARADDLLDGKNLDNNPRALLEARLVGEFFKSVYREAIRHGIEGEGPHGGQHESYRRGPS